MKIEDQVCLIEQAEKLKRLGVDQNSYFVWQKFIEPVPDSCATKRIETSVNVAHPMGSSGVAENFAAFTVAELGEMLPEEAGIRTFYTAFNAYTGWWDGKYFKLDEVEEENEVVDFEGDTEAEVRADIIIHLLENKIVTADVINKTVSFTA